MTKLLRKYNKWLLVIGGSLLLVTWLVQGSMAQFQPDPGKRIVATLMGQKIRAAEISKAEIEFRAIREFVPFVVQYQAGVESATHWFLLAREAEMHGFVGEAADGAEWLPELSKTEAQFEVLTNPNYRGFAQQLLSNPQMMAGNYDRTLKRLESLKPMMSGRNNLRPKEFEVALAKLRGVARLTNAYQLAGRMSDILMTDEVIKQRTQVSFDAVVIRPDQVPGVLDPTPEQLNEIFLKHKDISKGEGEMGFGYRLPKRAKVEYMTISKAVVSAAVVLDPVAVNKYWQQNRDKFKGEFTAEKNNVVMKLREEKTLEAMNEAERIYRAELRSATRRLDVIGGVKKLPADWEAQRPKMADLAQTIAAKVSSIKMPLPKVEILNAKHIPLDDFKTVGDLAFAQFQVGTEQGTIEQLLAGTFELSKSPALSLQVGVPFDGQLTDQQGDRLYLTVLDVKNENSADTLDEVREAVVKDAKRLAAFERLKAEAGTYLLLAATDGLEGVANMFASPLPADSPPDAKPTPLPIDRRVVVTKTFTPQQHPQYDSQQLRDDVLARVQALGFTTRASPENLAQRSLTCPLPKEQGLAVIVITGYAPVSVEDLRSSNENYAHNLVSQELRTITKESEEANPFSLKAIKERMAYVVAERTDGQFDTQNADEKPGEEKKPEEKKPEEKKNP